MHRREVLWLPVVLSSCSWLSQTPQQQQVEFAQVKQYVEDTSDTVIAASQAWINDPRATEAEKAGVVKAMDLLIAARAKFDAVNASDLANARAIANEILSILQSLSAMPAIVALLGPAGWAVSLGIGVIRAFATAIPPPPDAPAQPPPELRRRAAQLRARRR